MTQTRTWTATRTSEEVSCRICGGRFPALPADPVVGCVACERYAATGGPAHHSADHCRSGGVRRHPGCRSIKSHCSCESCY
jgi:hypothetical protein